jgi:hypothetical protein
VLPPFTSDGVLPAGDYPLTLEELRTSPLVTGEGVASPTWDAAWRGQLVDNLAVLVGQLWQAGVDHIFVDGSFVEEKDHPNDIDGYFECDAHFFASGQLERALNALDPFKVWTWSPASRRFDPNSAKRQLPMWHQYHVELYPHFPGLLSGIRDQFGNELPFPSAFRLSRRAYLPKGIVQIVKPSGERTPHGDPARGTGAGSQPGENP